jgi:anti-sigma regulatory factor (Ser/Thr protein kinase)
VIELTLHTLADLAAAQKAADTLVADHGIDDEAAYALHLAIEELASNVVRHGYDDRKPHDISLKVGVTADAVELTLTDDGRPFDPSRPHQMDTPHTLEEAPTGGMGLSLVSAIAGTIRYERVDGRNITKLDIRRR